MQITQKLLHEYFNYCQDSGILSWKKTVGSRAKAGQVIRCPDKFGYVVVRLKGKLYKAHRLIWAYTYGQWPEKNIDHVNGIKNDNRIKNLREATQKQNTRNREKQKNNTSGYKGVSFQKQIKRWTARIQTNKRYKHIGCFVTAEEAAAAYNEAALKHHGEFARLNEIGEVR